MAVRLRETAFNAICSQLQERDETLYVAFQQHIKFEVPSLSPSHSACCLPGCRAQVAQQGILVLLP